MVYTTDQFCYDQEYTYYRPVLKRSGVDQEGTVSSVTEEGEGGSEGNCEWGGMMSLITFGVMRSTHSYPDLSSNPT